MCTNVASGDPNNACPTNASTCTAGGCTNGACTASPTGTVCNTSCMTTNMFAVAKCNGSTTSCPALGAPIACAGDLICADASSCKQTCSADGDCVGQYWCNGGNCQQQGNAGDACTPGSASSPCPANAASCDQCKSGGCNIYYRDADADLHGNPNSTVYACTSAPTGYVTSNDDCCDADVNVHPGQAGWFYSASSACAAIQNPFWNYDCSPTIEEQYGSAKAVCTSSGTCGCSNPLSCTMTVQGWVVGDPGCGIVGSWLMKCGVYGDCAPGSCGGDGGGASCNASMNQGVSRQQGCH
jgi:hypothetical protein